MTADTLDFEYLRQQIVGVDSSFATPFGERLMSYCDYTASGRCLLFIEEYLQRLQRVYANTHTEDDISGRSMSQLLQEAEESIKRSVNAGPDGRIVACGTGATGAIDKFQQLVGVSLPPATRKNLLKMLDASAPPFSSEHAVNLFSQQQPVIFLGPYEHHSNEISWRESLATTVEVPLGTGGDIDLNRLEILLRDPKYQNRLRIGSFSAASNVTGVRTDVHKIACLLHRHGALACFDYAACAPYVSVDMNPAPLGKDDPSIDAIFVSPHKFLGGPGSSGVLVFNKRIYDRELPPTLSAGGTVDYVGTDSHDYIEHIEDRERAGTPGVLQTLKAGLVFQLKDHIGISRIAARENELNKRVLTKWGINERIEILGTPDPEKRIGIVSFNVKHPSGSYLHHKFVTALLNDLFGIQSRAGCSCAGPYGHRLLEIDEGTSCRYRNVVRDGYGGMKPGWCRIGLHWVLDDPEANFVVEAVEFIASQGHLFLDSYDFDIHSGTWTHKSGDPDLPALSLNFALAASDGDPPEVSTADREVLYRKYLNEAQELAAKLSAPPARPIGNIGGELGELQFFALPLEIAERHGARLATIRRTGFMAGFKRMLGGK